MSCVLMMTYEKKKRPVGCFRFDILGLKKEKERKGVLVQAQLYFKIIKYVSLENCRLTN